MAKEEIKKLIDFHGKTKTKIITIEELSELQKEITKDLREELNKDNLIKEIADVCICIEMLQDIYKISDTDLIKAIVEKMERNIERTKGKWQCRVCKSRDFHCEAYKTGYTELELPQEKNGKAKEKGDMFDVDTEQESYVCNECLAKGESIEHIADWVGDDE